jgi:transposase
MRFEEAYESWNRRRLTQEEAASLLRVSERTFRRYLNRFEAEGESGWLDRRLEQGSNRRAPVDEVLAFQEQYRSRYTGWNARHFHR